MLGATYLADGASVNTFSGQTGTIVAGKNNTNFSASHPINQYIDEIRANQGTVLFRCNRNIDRAVCYEESTNKYKVIYSAFCFGGLRGIEAKNDLMKIYMDWLIGTTGITQTQLAQLAGSLFITSVYGKNRINFSLIRPAGITINLYSVAGKLVMPLVDNTFDAGSHQLEIRPNMSSGNYIIKVQADNMAVEKKLVIVK